MMLEQLTHGSRHQSSFCVFTSTVRRQRAQWEWPVYLNSQNGLPLYSYSTFSNKFTPSNASQIGPTTGDQISKCMSLLGTILTSATTLELPHLLENLPHAMDQLPCLTVPCHNRFNTNWTTKMFKQHYLDHQFCVSAAYSRS